jgi:hypothetical protein
MSRLEPPPLLQEEEDDSKNGDEDDENGREDGKKMLKVLHAACFEVEGHHCCESKKYR